MIAKTNLPLVLDLVPSLQSQPLVSIQTIVSYFANLNRKTNIFKAKVKTERAEEFNYWKILGSGRWAKVHHKNPNEYDREDLIDELNQLPDDVREEVYCLLYK